MTFYCSPESNSLRSIGWLSPPAGGALQTQALISSLALETRCASRSSRTLVPIYKFSIRDLRPHIWSALSKTLNLSQSSVWNFKRSLRTILFSCTIFVRWNTPSDQLWSRNRVIYDPDCEKSGVSRVFMSARCVSAYTFDENQIRGAHGKVQGWF